jgi:hypothetical protein
MSELLKDLQKAISGQADKVPAGFRTMRQIADDEGHEVSWAKKAMQKVIKAGTWEQKSFRIVTGCGLRMVPHYRRK